MAEHIINLDIRGAIVPIYKTPRFQGNTNFDFKSPCLLVSMLSSISLWRILLPLSFLTLDLIDAQAHEDQILSSSWTLDEGNTNEFRLEQASAFPQPIVNTESLLISDKSSDCADQQSLAAPGKMRRLRFAKREQPLLCPVQEFTGPSAGEEPPRGEDAGSTSGFNPNRKTRPTRMRKLINENRLRPITDISVCGFDAELEIPICAPYFVSPPGVTVVVLNPCRFCE